MITGYTKFDFDEDQGNIKKTVKAYQNYKKWFKFPQGLQGTHFHFCIKLIKINYRTLCFNNIMIFILQLTLTN